MKDDHMIRAYITAAAILMDDLSARLRIDPQREDLPGELRRVAVELNTLAQAIESIHRHSRSSG